jgi:hypothetical protein
MFNRNDIEPLMMAGRYSLHDFIFQLTVGHGLTLER